MAIGVVLLVIVILVVLIWLLMEFKQFRHKIWAVFLIALILFTYFSFTTVLKGKDIDLKSVSGLTQATKLYFSWLGSAFANVKTITTNAIHMDWRNTNKTSSDSG
mgnify:CR=1 FL=1